MFSRLITLAVLTLALATSPAEAAGKCGRSVPLAAANVAPSGALILAPGERVRLPRELSDVNAYHWNGRAFGPQCGNHWRSVWGRVVLVRSSSTIVNKSTRTVLVAYWR